MKDYEIQSIVSLLERAAKALEKSDDYRHKELQKRWKSPTTTGIKSWQD